MQKIERPIGKEGTIILNIDRCSDKYTPQKLFTMALRKNNKKRSFLFVSEVLGKHIPIKSKTLIDATKELAKEYAQKLHLKKENEKYIVSKPTVFIGFAETATAMGQSFFDNFSGDVIYLQSTREVIENTKPLFYACEAHSHATDHSFYLNDSHFMDNSKEIVLIDDELTTGNTALNLIEDIKKSYPNRDFSVVSFLDWRSGENRESFKKLDIKTVSLLDGSIENIDAIPPTGKSNTVSGSEKISNYNKKNLTFSQSGFYAKNRKFIKNSGRFGITPKDRDELNSEIERAISNINSLGEVRKTLVLGQGEFMYIPMRISNKIIGESYFHATTRSPAWAINLDDYGIKSGLSFLALDGSDYQEYVYNIKAYNYNRIILITEYSCEKKRVDNFMNLLDIKDLHHIVIGE